MKKFAGLVLVACLVVCGCTNVSQPPAPPPDVPLTLASTFKIATFNVQNFGKTKAAKPEIMSQLADIIRRYDVVAVQEVSDITGNAPRQLLAAINANGANYAMLLSPRTGEQPDDKSSQEQYAFYYRQSTIHARDIGCLYPDSEHDYFQREPFVAGFTAGTQKFVLITIHTMPTHAVQEIASLAKVIDWARTQYPGEDDFVTLGDFNASCGYASPTQLAQLRQVLPYLWIVPDSSDSNVSDTTACAYDRIIVTNGLTSSYTHRWGVDQAFTSKTVSDHWPVWAEFSLTATQ